MKHINLRFGDNANPALFAVCLLVFFTCCQISELASSTPENCEIAEVKITGKRSAAKLAVTIACAATSRESSVLYPAGPLYLGVSLFKVDGASLRDLVIPYEDNGNAQYVPHREIVRKDGRHRYEIDMGNMSDLTHILIAVWDKQNKCRPEGSSCLAGSLTLGDVDEWGMPIPIDAWPRPVCDVKRLAKSGFFEWVVEDGDLGGTRVPDKYDSMLSANDCWIRFPKRGGLGYSVRRWRLAPMSKL